jgi:lysophospholipase L1-like esterase
MYPLFLTVLTAALLSFSCKKEEAKPQSTMHKEEKPAALPDSIRLLCLGDSYTKGQGVAKEASFPFVLKDTLIQIGVIVDSLKVIAETGWTTTNLSDAIDGSSLEPEWDFVTLLIGVNNQYQGKPIEHYRPEFEDLVLKAIHLAKGKKERVLIISIPDYGFTSFGETNQEAISEEIDLYNVINKAVSDSLGIAYVNITAISRENQEGWEAVDELHPSGDQYKAWVQFFMPTVLELLRR